MPIPVVNPNTIYPPDLLRTLNIQTNTSAAMTAGSVTITGVTLTANSKIFLTINTVGGTAGDLTAPVASRNTSTGQFVITSTSGTDTSTVDWLIVG